MRSESSKAIAVVLAGGNADDPMARSAGVASKGLVPYAGKPLYRWVVDALRSTARVDGIAIVGPLKAGEAGAGVVCVPGGNSFSASLALGAGAGMALRPAAPLLFVTADLPWLEAPAVDRFLEAAQGADLAYPIVSESDSTAQFPGQRRTYVRLRQGRFTGGNLFFAQPHLVGPLLDLTERAYGARKNPLRLARMIGAGTLVSLVSGRAHLAGLEATVGGILGGDARAVVTADACLAADVDRTEQLAGPGPARGVST